MIAFRHLLPLLAAWLACGLPARAQQRLPLHDGWTIQATGGEPRPLKVPAAFETALGTGFDGVATCAVTLPLRPDWRGARIRVEFAAVATHATVRCNGSVVATHLGGWTPFRADLTGHLRWQGDDRLEVLVDERVGHNTQGFLPIIQPHFGGIWQEVTLCVDHGPVFDRQGVFAFGRGGGELLGSLRILDDGGGRPLRVRAVVSDGAQVVWQQEATPDQDLSVALRGTVPGVRQWRPGAPHLYHLELSLRDAATGAELDRLLRSVGFRDLRADGTRVLWNGAPLQVRGILHWGYSPPHLAPPADEAFWRPQLEAFRARGFNLVKCCLWVPPASFYRVCDEIGLLVWQEYPTWHPKMDQAHLAELRAEYQEFFAHDRSHPSVAFRSLTCETGHSAELAVIEELFRACKAAVPDTLLVDDSSWIGWQRITDFWDEHPYGNNSWWLGRLQAFRAHIREKGRKPLLLGECLAADTWVDRAAWLDRHGEPADGEAPWWRPLCWEAQEPAEAWLAAAFGQDEVATLEPIARAFGLQNRKYQIERLRLTIPDAGYVMSVARDFGKARMGLWDDLDRPKWSAADFAWQSDTMLCLDLDHRGRAQPGAIRVPVRVSHLGQGPLRGSLRLSVPAVTGAPAVTAAVELAPGAVGRPVTLTVPVAAATVPTRVTVTADLDGTHRARNRWSFWSLPPWREDDAAGVREVTALDADTLDFLEQGGAVLLRAGDRPGSLRTEALWFLKGAPFAPAHPLHRQLPREFLLELAAFDLETGVVMPWALLRDQVDPILAFWETHDVPEVRFHLLAFDCRVGKGRLLATTLDLEQPAGRFVRTAFREHLRQGPAPRRALDEATLAGLRGLLAARTLPLPTWRFRTDPDDVGLAQGWAAQGTDAAGAPWRELRAGAHWENQAEDLRHFTGVGWYRVDVAVPADWAGLPARAVFDGVDDSFTVWLNGEQVGRFGDPATGHTVWLERTVAELGTRLRPGAINTLVLRVVDHQGSGGLWKPVFLTTGPADERARLLHR